MDNRAKWINPYLGRWMVTVVDNKWSDGWME